MEDFFGWMKGGKIEEVEGKKEGKGGKEKEGGKTERGKLKSKT